MASKIVNGITYYTFDTVFPGLRRCDERVQILFGRAHAMQSMGVLTRDAAKQIQAYADRVYNLEMQIYNDMVAAITTLKSAAASSYQGIQAPSILQYLANSTASTLISQIPRPTRSVLSTTGTTQTGTKGLRGVGLAGWPMVIVGVVAVAAIVGGLYWLRNNHIENLAETEQVGENVALSLSTWSSALSNCLASGKTGPECAAAVGPMPTVQTQQKNEDEANRRMWWVVGVGAMVVVIAGLAYAGARTGVFRRTEREPKLLEA